MIENSNVWVISDKEENLWRVFLNNDNEIVYDTMYGSDRWTKEKRLDKDIVEFFLDVDDEYNIHIVYRNSREIKYCVWNGKQWLGKVIYELNVNEYIENIKILVLNSDINIFFVSGNYETKQSEIIHYRFNNFDSEFKTVCSISSESNVYYTIEILEQMEINLILLENAKENKFVSRFIYKGSWSKKEELYHLEGENIQITTIAFNNRIYILNLSQSNNTSYLEEVNISANKEINYTKIYETKNKIDEIILTNRVEYIEAVWNENDDVLHSCFTTYWSKAENIIKSKNYNLSIYNSKIINVSKKKIIGHKIIGSNYPEIRFWLTDKNGNENFNIDDLNEALKTYINNNNDEVNKVKDNRNEIENKSNKTIKFLNKKIANLKLQLEKSEMNYESIKEQLEVLDLKNKGKEKNLIEFKKAFEDTAKELKDFKDSYEKSISENNGLKEKVETLKKEYDEKNQSTNLLEDKVRELMIDKKLLEERLSKHEDKFIAQSNKYNEDIQILKDELKQKEFLLLERDEENRKLDDELRKKERELNEKEEKYNELQILYKNKDKQYDEIKRELERNSNKNKEIEVLLEDKENAFNVIKLESENKKEKLESLIYENQTLKNEIEEAQDEIYTLSEEKEKLKGKLEEELNKSFISKIWNKRGGS